MQTKKRIVLWQKQRQFLDACLLGDCTVSQIIKKIGASNKMLMQWLGKPLFARHYARVQAFQTARAKMDIAICKTRGAERLNRMMQGKSDDDKCAAIAMKVIAGKPARKKPRKPANGLRRLAHPDHNDDQRTQLANAIQGKR